MSKAAYWQRGETLDYPNTGTDVIEANSILTIGSRLGIAGTEIKPGEVGSVHVTGVFEMPKKANDTAVMGTDVYFDGDQITTSADNGESGNDKVSYVHAGYTARDMGASDTSALVKIG